MVVSPKKKEMFLVDVKGLYRKNPWIVKRKAAREKLLYILAFVTTDDTNRFFVLKQETANHLIRKELLRLKRPDDYPLTGISWTLALPHEDAWQELPK